MQLNVKMADVQCRLVDDEPNYFVSLSEDVRGQLAARIKEVSAQAAASPCSPVGSVGRCGNSSSGGGNGNGGRHRTSRRHGMHHAGTRTSRRQGFDEAAPTLADSEGFVGRMRSLSLRHEPEAPDDESPPVSSAQEDATRVSRAGQQQCRHMTPPSCAVGGAHAEEEKACLTCEACAPRAGGCAAPATPLEDGQSSIASSTAVPLRTTEHPSSPRV